MPEPDEWLMQQVALGSASHLDLLIRRHAHAILTFTTRLLGSTHRGEEAFQETFMAVWSRRRTYKYPCYFRPWLFRIAHNQCRALMRPFDFLAHGDQTDPEYLDSSHGSSAMPGPAQAAIATETSTLVDAAMARLPAQQRAIVVMRIWNAMSYAEIAETLGLAEASARSSMHYALQTIRRYLEPRLR